MTLLTQGSVPFATDLRYELKSIVRQASLLLQVPQIHSALGLSVDRVLTGKLALRKDLRHRSFADRTARCGETNL